MKAILFDIDDTIYDQTQPFWRAFTETFANQYDERIDEGIFAAYRKCSDEVFEASEQGLISMEEMYIYRMRKAMAGYGIEISDEAALLFQGNYRNAQNHITISDEMNEIMQYCKTMPVKLGVISNGPAEHQAGKIDRLGITKWIPEENIFISGAVGAMKPDQQIFSYAAKMMQLLTADTYYIGDSYANDIVGAKQAGWQAIWFNRRGHQIQNEKIQPDHIVSDEKQLNRLIQDILN